MNALTDLLAKNRNGETRGIAAWCTAHPETLSAVFACYRHDSAPILIEATCNQVNQQGGYTGMTPAAFRRFVEGLAIAQDVDPARIVLGGDHLGPNPWRHLPAAQAMDHAQAMVAAYVQAGFSKIHLDASMPCGGETLLPPEMARRAAALAAAAEAAANSRPLTYVIGTEVPIPGGETTPVHALQITTAEGAKETLALHRDAFADNGMGHVMARVVALVVQPGVDFGNAQIIPFDPPAAAGLRTAVAALGGPVFEAHSTDYQTDDALRALVQGHFAILKVGPELTFAYRQAVLALERLAHLIGLPAGVEAALRQAMAEDPRDWRAHVAKGQDEGLMMIWGLSDRVRYYWPKPQVQAAQQALFASLRAAHPPPGLVAQVTGGPVAQIDPATLPETVIQTMVGAVVARYRTATGDYDAA